MYAASRAHVTIFATCSSDYCTVQQVAETVAQVLGTLQQWTPQLFYRQSLGLRCNY